MSVNRAVVSRTKARQCSKTSYPGNLTAYDTYKMMMLHKYQRKSCSHRRNNSVLPEVRLTTFFPDARLAVVAVRHFTTTTIELFLVAFYLLLICYL